MKRAGSTGRAGTAVTVRANTAGAGLSRARQAARGECEGVPAAQVAEIQRSRLLAAAVGAIEELGYPGVTVAQITSRARVSRRTFYELFDNSEACLLALIEECVAAIEGELATAGLEGLTWRERVRGGLAVILGFMDREAALARVCLLQAVRGGPEVQERRRQILTRLAAVLDEGHRESVRASDRAQLTGEGLVGAAFWIVCDRLAERDERPLSSLLGELTSMIVLPYLGAAAARREQTRRAPGPESVAHRTGAEPERDPLQQVPMRLTYRTVRVLDGIAQHPGISNRNVAEHAGITDQGQVSKLLARLERLGVTANAGEGHLKGEPNAWQLTALGEEIAQRLCLGAPRQSGASVRQPLKRGARLPAALSVPRHGRLATAGRDRRKPNV